jgi:hypothetical protein
MKQLHIESLFGDRYPHASFHDSRVYSFGVNLPKKEAVFDCLIFVGNPDDRESQPREARGVLTLTGLLYIAVEPPTYHPFEDDWMEISYDGPVESTNFKGPIPKLPDLLPDDSFHHCFYINNWNSFMFIAATSGQFEWS